MLTEPMEVLTRFPVRKSRAQKRAFREAVGSYLTSLDYRVQEEKGSFGARNLVIGDPEGAKYLVTAHYDTCARLPIPNYLTPCSLWGFLAYQMLIVALFMAVAFVLGLAAGLLTRSPEVATAVSYIGIWTMVVLMILGPANPSNANDNTSGVVTLLEIARTLPENQRGKVCFVLFDLEEAGLLGSASYRKAHKAQTDRQLVLNLDCVGDGDHIRLFPTRKLKKDPQKRARLYRACGYFGKKEIVLVEKGFSIYPSDQANFPWGVGICALNKGRLGLYLGRIHTKKDTVLDNTNINLLRAALSSFIACDEEEQGKEEEK